MTTKHNLEQKARRLRKQYVGLLKKLSETADITRLPTVHEQRATSIAVRSLRRTYEDLCKVEARLRKMP